MQTAESLAKNPATSKTAVKKFPPFPYPTAAKYKIPAKIPAKTCVL